MSLSDLARAAADADGTDPFNEATRIGLRADDEPRVLLQHRHEDEIVAAAVAFGDTPVELVVHPGHRRRGLGRELATTLLAEDERRFWAHGDLPGARGLAATLGLQATRILLVLRATLHEAPMEQVPEGITLRTFTDTDADALIDVNARAFADHPEQGAMDHADFLRRTAEPWFDPNGLFVAERDGQLVGFHWTKVDEGPDGEVGEVYVVGVDPDAHGSGLGTALTARGLRYLYERGVATVELYVEGDNAPALAVYRRLGFVEDSRDTLYAS